MIREFISLVLESSKEEDKLKTWALAHGDRVEQLLASIGIIPIPHGKLATSQLGRGSFNTVYEVIWNGKRVVARVSDDRNEMLKMQDLLHIKMQVANKYKVHFPQVYDYIDEPEVPAFGCVMEMLKPLDVHLSHDLDSGGFNKKIKTYRQSVINQLLDVNSELVKGTINELVRFTDSRHDIRRGIKQDPEVQKDKLRKFFTSKVIPLVKSAIKENLTANALATNIEENIAETDDRIIISFVYMLRKHLLHSFVPMTNKTGSHTFGKRAAISTFPSKQVKKFYEFLGILESIGVTYDDLHTDNFMIRPSTGDIVIVDPGFFNFAGGNSLDK